MSIDGTWALLIEEEPLGPDNRVIEVRDGVVYQDGKRVGVCVVETIYKLTMDTGENVELRGAIEGHLDASITYIDTPEQQWPDDLDTYGTLVRVDDAA